MVAGDGAGIAGDPPRRRQENEQQKRAGHTRYAAGGGERKEGSVGSSVSMMSREMHRGQLSWQDPAPAQPRAPSLSLGRERNRNAIRGAEQHGTEDARPASRHRREAGGVCHSWHRPKIPRRSPTRAPAPRGRLGAPRCSRVGDGCVPPSGICPRSGRGARSPSPARRRHHQTRHSVPAPSRPPSESAPSTRG